MACVLFPSMIAAQGLSGALIGTVRDAQGGVVPGATVRLSSPALIGGEATVVTNERGQLRFATLPPGRYVLSIDVVDSRPIARRTFRSAPVRPSRGLSV